MRGDELTFFTVYFEATVYAQTTRLNLLTEPVSSRNTTNYIILE